MCVHAHTHPYVGSAKEKIFKKMKREREKHTQHTHIHICVHMVKRHFFFKEERKEKKLRQLRHLHILAWQEYFSLCQSGRHFKDPEARSDLSNCLAVY